MKTQPQSWDDRLLNRKLGAFEILVGALAFELFFGSAWRFWLCAVLAVLFFFAKREFEGEFSLLDLLALFSDDNDNDSETKEKTGEP